MRVYNAVSYPEFETRLFLAGSIDMGEAENWQTRVIKKLEDLDNLLILNPRRDDWDSSWEESLENDQFVEQVVWEQAALQASDVILFWFSPDSKAPITLLEFGLFAGDRTKTKIVYCPKEFYRSGNVHIICRLYGIPFFTTEEELFEHLYGELTCPQSN